MSNKYFVGDIGTEIIVNCGESISGASVHKLKIQKPDGVKVEWDTTIYNNNYLKHTVENGDWDKAGTYVLQVYLEINGWKGHGNKTIFYIEGVS